MTLKIRTNNVPRDIVYGDELTREEAKEFDYIPGWNLQGVMLYDDESLDEAAEFSSYSFVRYKGYVYDLSEFMRLPDGMFGDQQWDGYRSDSSFSGVLVRLVDGGERVVCATYTT